MEYDSEKCHMMCILCLLETLKKLSIEIDPLINTKTHNNVIMNVSKNVINKY